MGVEVIDLFAEFWLDDGGGGEDDDDSCVACGETGDASSFGDESFGRYTECES